MENCWEIVKFKEWNLCGRKLGVKTGSVIGTLYCDGQ